jgi:hypothetical protein
MRLKYCNVPAPAAQGKWYNFKAFDSGSKVFRICTMLGGNKGKKSLYETLKKNIQM